MSVGPRQVRLGPLLFQFHFSAFRLYRVLEEFFGAGRTSWVGWTERTLRRLWIVAILTLIEIFQYFRISMSYQCMSTEHQSLFGGREDRIQVILCAKDRADCVMKTACSKNTVQLLELKLFLQFGFYGLYLYPKSIMTKISFLSIIQLSLNPPPSARR